MTALVLLDTRVDCLSVVRQMRVDDYLRLVRDAYEHKGGIRNQRGALKTTTARRIRQRMIDDIAAGAVIPPVVIGYLVDAETIKIWSKIAKPSDLLIRLDQQISPEHISIIDGMQRTTALLEACDRDPEVKNRDIRVEFWISEDVNALIYRMLVLNAGQIPWDVKKQVEVIFEPIISATKKHTTATRIIEYGSGRRFNPGEYKASDIAEMYLAFSARKLSVDAQEVLTDEFTKLDIVDAISRFHFREYFFRTIDLLVMLDEAFSRYTRETDVRTPAGRKIFDKQTARIGFVTAVGIEVLGRVGMDRERADTEEAFKRVEGGLTDFCRRLRSMNQAELAEFMAYNVLDETLNKRVGQIGRFERSLFFEAFRTLINENFDVPTMEVCWRAQL